MAKDTILEYSSEYYGNSWCISTYNEIVKNFKMPDDEKKKNQNKKCPRCGSTNTKPKSGNNICLICGDYF